MARKAAASAEDAFLQTILTHPDDDIPRLVFADWLEEHGNPRGAFIRLQCERAKLTQYDPAWKVLLAQEAALLKQHEAEWSKPVLRYLDGVHYRRGFIEHVTVTVAKLLKNGERLFRAAPVASIRLEGVNNLLPRLADCSWLVHVKELDLSQEVFSSKDLQTLLQAVPHGSLRVLRLYGCGLLEAGARMVADAACLHSLQVLDLSNNGIYAQGAHSLAHSTHLPQLRELFLAGNQLLADGVEALTTKPEFRLQRLSLASNSLGNDAAVAIARCAEFSELRYLDLQYNAVGNLGVEALVQSPYMSNVEHLNLHGNDVSSRGVQLLSDSALLGNLTFLDLRGNEIDKPTMQTLPQRLQTPKMRELRF